MLSGLNLVHIAAKEGRTRINFIKLSSGSLDRVRHPGRCKIVALESQITLKQMRRDFIGIRVNRTQEGGMVHVSSSVTSVESNGSDNSLHELNTLFSINFFFFQAEDGIRYYKVTGVQTCALPI